MAQTKISEGIEMLTKRHAAAGAKVGTTAIGELKKLSNTDPSEGVWNKGDKFTVPGKELLDQCVMVIPVNGNSAPAIAVDTNNGPKTLYFSTLKKSVVEYEEDGDEFRVKRNADGSSVGAHYADTPLRKEIMGKATIADIAEALAGRTFEVTDIMGPYKTSRLKAKYNELGQRDGYEVVGLRNTSIPVFTEVK